jgi:hypothetical protein
MKKLSLREEYINTIMKKKYGENYSKSNNVNELAFFEILTLKELANMASNDFEDDDDGEIGDLDDNELSFEDEL